MNNHEHNEAQQQSKQVQGNEVLGNLSLKVEVTSEPELKHITPKKGLNEGEEIAVLSFKAKVKSSHPPIKEDGKIVKPELKVEFFDKKAEALEGRICEGMELYLSGYTRANSVKGQIYYRVYGSFAAVSLREIESLDFAWQSEHDSAHAAGDDHARDEVDSVGQSEESVSEPAVETEDVTADEAA
ncbi:MAG: hypothetical protein IJ228_10330 [Succinivibrio sp.]|nr:hypothetical protein [Succinivibrio sp.]